MISCCDCRHHRQPVSQRKSFVKKPRGVNAVGIGKDAELAALVPEQGSGPPPEYMEKRWGVKRTGRNSEGC